MCKRLNEKHFSGADGALENRIRKYRKKMAILTFFASLAAFLRLTETFFSQSIRKDIVMVH
jgi:hypothetical protein